MTQKFNRIYEADFVIPNQSNSEITALSITYPITCDFHIQKSCTMKLNTGRFSFYNLKQSTRDLLYQDRFNVNWDKSITFNAGYLGLSDKEKANIATIFKGNIIQSKVSRKGADIITEILCQDGQFAVQNALANITIDNNMGFTDLIQKMANAIGFPVNDKINSAKSSIQNYNFPRGMVLNGNIFDEVQKIYNNNIFIDNKVVNMLDENECYDSDFVLNSESGLCDVPQLEGRYITCNILFEPNILVGQLINIDSYLERKYNIHGPYKIVGIEHSGTISDRVAGDLKTKLQLFRPLNLVIL